MIAAQRVEKLNESLKEAREAAGKMIRVEIFVEGKSVGLAEPHLAKAAFMAIKLQNLKNQVEEEIANYKEEIKVLLKEAGIKQRPVKLYIKGEGDVVVSKASPTVSISDAKGLYGVLKKKFFELVSFKAKKGLIKLACDADSEEGKKIREFLEVTINDDDTVKVTAKRK